MVIKNLLACGRIDFTGLDARGDVAPRRFFTLRESVFRNPDSYFRHFAELTDEQAEATARQIWASINGRNLRENIAPTRDRASLILRKSSDHRVSEVRLRKL